MGTNYTKKELKKLRKLLPQNWDDILSKKCERAKSTVRKALYLVNINNSIVEEAFILAKEYQTEQKIIIENNKNLIKDGKI